MRTIKQPINFNQTYTQSRPGEPAKLNEVIKPEVKQGLIEAAQKSIIHYRHAAAVLDKKGNPICYAHNLPGKHAEVAALEKYQRAYKPRGYKAHSLIVIRINKQNKFKLSKPCDNCTNTLLHSDLTIYHT